MRFDRQKAFPYPVLRPESDDYTDAEFQASVEFSIGSREVVAKISYANSSDEIRDEVVRGNAEYVSIVSCRDTYFRKILATQDISVEGKFDIGELRGEVRIEPYVYVRKKIVGYSSTEINSEFGVGPFGFEVGDILAQDEPQVFYFDRDMFKPLTSVFELVKNDELSNGQWVIGFDEEEVQIEVSPKMKESIDDARNCKANQVILLNSLYFAAVMQAVQKLQSDKSAFEGKRWAAVMRRQAHNKGCDLEREDAYLIAQQLMHYPLGVLQEYIFKGGAK